MATRWLNSDEQRAWRAFLDATRRLYEELDRELQRDAGIPHAYYEILVRLSEAPDRTLRMSSLADVVSEMLEQLGSPSNISSISIREVTAQERQSEAMTIEFPAGVAQLIIVAFDTQCLEQLGACIARQMLQVAARC